ncbi:MAG: hypothetical protein LQ350_002920 [Teloschistes chrysophthalmus]|nr:MAG: hypothetical protein LQ350_002920 [Niorma chrysophthalma]
MATLSDAIPDCGTASAVLVPHTPQALTFTFDDLKAHVLDFQKKLAHLGIATQNAVSIALPNSYEFIVAFLAIAAQRAVAAPLNPAYKQSEFDFYISDLESALILVPKNAVGQDGPAIRSARKYGATVAECFWNGRHVALHVKEPGRLANARAQCFMEPRPDDVALVLHTSGTTGRPKAVWQFENIPACVNAYNLLAITENIKDTYALAHRDRTMLVMPLFHVHGLLAGFLAPLFSGGSIVLPLRFSASEFWVDFISNQANWYTAVPTIHQILLQTSRPSKLPCIRFIRSCSSPLSPAIFHELERAFKAPVLEAYAMTEAAHQIASNPLPPGNRVPGSVGIGWGVEVKVMDPAGIEVPRGSEAEICIRSNNVTRGYLNNAEANKSSFTPEGFFRTGDQGTQDQDGYIIITGRIKELINKGGEKISPVELDNVVAQHPAVAEVVCFAVPDKMYGQDVGMAVLCRKGTNLTKDELRQWMATKVAKFKVAKEVRTLMILEDVRSPN